MARNLQDHILNTAADLFYSQGIKTTGIDNIVKVSGVAKMSLYKYFPSKDALVLAYLHKSGAALLASVQQGLQARAGTPEQKLLAVFDVFAEVLANPNFRGCPFINATAEYADETHPIQQAVADFYFSVTQLLADLARQTSMATPEELAKQLVVLLSGAIVIEQIQKQGQAMRTAYTAAEILIKNSLAVS